jgi:hypothetical protein
MQSDLFAYNNTGFCSSPESCATRMNNNLNMTSSSSYPDTFFPYGFLSPYAEENPNFYKAISVIVPYCSSDLFLGDATDASSGTFFHGRRIVETVLKDLQATKQLNTADSIVLIGGVGPMNSIPFIRSMLANHTRLYAVCDSCLMVDTAPFIPEQSDSNILNYSEYKHTQNQDISNLSSKEHKPSITTPLSPLIQSFAQGFTYWKAESYLCSSYDWTCLVGQTFINSLTKQVPLDNILIQQPLFDQYQLASLNAWPPAPQNERFISTFADSIRQMLFALNNTSATMSYLQSNHHHHDDEDGGMIVPIAPIAPIAPFVIGSACSYPQSCSLNRECTFHVQVPYLNQYKYPVSANLILELTNMVKAHSNQQVFAVDDCSSVGCNPTCTQESVSMYE